MLRCVRFFVLLLATVWLPIQTAAAMVMPIAALAGAAAGQAGTDNAASDAACPMHQASAQARDRLADHGNTPDTSGAGTPTGGNCAHCGICHLAGTGYLPTVAHIAPLVVPARLAPVARIALIDGITSPPLDHPPRTLV